MNLHFLSAYQLFRNSLFLSIPRIDNCVSRPRRNPLFFIDLMADANGIHYSTPLKNFETVLVSLFDKGIQACHSVPQLEKVSCAFALLGC